MKDENRLETIAIKRHVLSEARYDRNDVTALPSNRGGVELRVLSYLDVLLESDIITEAQANYGRNFWSLKDTVFHELQTKIGKYDYDTPIDEGMLEAIEERAELSEAGMSTEIYLCLLRLLEARFVTALKASCNSLEAAYLPNRMAIIWAFGENTLRQAFEALEANYNKAKENAENRMKQQNNPCSSFENA